MNEPETWAMPAFSVGTHHLGHLKLVAAPQEHLSTYGLVSLTYSTTLSVTLSV